MEKLLGKDKKISVIIPVYNCGKYLREAIDSIRNQTLKNLEIIVIYDKSTDDSFEILSDLAAKDSRIIIIENDKKAGVAYALNLGLNAATGDYIARMDGDDISLPDRFEKQVSFLESHADILMCGGAIRKIVDGKLEKNAFHYPTSPDDIRAGMLFKNEFAHPTVMFNAKLLKESGMTYDSSIPGEDYHFWIRLSKDYKMANLYDVVLHFRVYSESTSNKSIDIASSEIAKYQTLLLSTYGIEAKLDRHIFYGAKSLDELQRLEGYINQFMSYQTKNCSFKQFRGYVEGMYHNTEHFAGIRINGHKRFFKVFGKLYNEMNWTGRYVDWVTTSMRNVMRRLYHFIKQ